MTTPVERMRSLRFGREMAEILARDSSTPSAVRSLATVALASYPTTEQWIDLLCQPGKPLPSGLAHGVRSMRQLLENTQVTRDKGGEFHCAVRRTLRHFPSVAEIDAWCGPKAVSDIRDQLAFETDWDRRAIPVLGPLRSVEPLGLR
jgi:hypothetical protein